MLIHTGDEHHSLSTVNFCGKSFTQKCHDTKHMLIQTGDLKQHFNQHKSTNEKCNLTMHIVDSLISGHKPRSCEICGKSFTENGKLRKRIRIHSKENNHSQRKLIHAGNIRHGYKTLENHLL